MTVKRLSNSKLQYDDGNGVLASSYRLFFYAAGSSTKQNTYNSSAGSVANSNPVVLNALGEPAVEIWLTAGQSYKVGLAIPGTDDPPSSFVWTEDNITGVNDTTSLLDQWVAGPTPTFISGTSFSLVGDQTTIFHVGRRVKTTNTSGTVYSTIISSTFGAVTTVVVSNDSASLDAGLSAVSYGLLSKSNDAAPRGVFPTMANMIGHIGGLTYANNGSDATNDIDIAAGRCVDSTGADVLVVSALTKQSDAAWAVGNAAGGLDNIGSAGNNDFYIWAIKRVDTQVTDILFSLSSTAPTMPANYTLKRLIGWFKRVGGTIVAFHTYETEGGGLEMNWDVPTLDINLANTLTTASRTDAVKVPLNFSTTAHLNVVIDDNVSGIRAWIRCPDQTSAAPSGTVAPLWNVGTQSTPQDSGCQLKIRTSAAGLIAAIADTATVDLYAVVTIGFAWARR